MASELYEQIGVDRTASSARIRSAYGQAVARLSRRRRALVEQGGATDQLDLQRAHLDEAWAVLADPLRRRRYDALLAWSEGVRSVAPEVVWDEVADSLVHPAAAVAAKLLRVTSRLTEIGSLPLAPSGAADEPPTLVPHDDDLTVGRATRLGTGTRTPAPAESVSDPTLPRLAMPRPGLRAADAATPIPAAPRVAESSLRVVDGSPGSSDVLVLPRREEPKTQGLSADEIAKLVDEHGYGGGLLKAVRARLLLSVQDVADHTRISVKYLEALEAETRDALPSPTFVRGYVREVARMLQLDADAVVTGYMRRFEG